LPNSARHLYMTPSVRSPTLENRNTFISPTAFTHTGVIEVSDRVLCCSDLE